MKTNPSFKHSCLIAALLIPAMLFGQTQKQYRDTSPFSGVSTSGIVSVFLTQGDSYSVLVESSPDHIDDITTSVKDNVLSIQYSGRSRSTGDITAYVTAPFFDQLSASGASSFAGTNILTNPSLSVTGSGAVTIKLEVYADMLTTSLSGASNMTISGQAIRHMLTVSGACFVRAYELDAEVTEAIISGASSSRVTTSNVLDVKASGTASLTYRGTPATKKISASGLTSVRGLDDDEVFRSETRTDTVTVTIGQREVQVIDGDSQKTQVSVKKRPAMRFRDNWSGLELGVNGFLTADNSTTLPTESEVFDLKYNKSIAVNLNLWQHNLVLVRNNLALVTGLGIGWNNYRFSTDDLLVKGPQQVVHDPGLYEYNKNKLTITHLNVPFLMEFQTSSNRSSEKFHLSAGVNVGLRIGSHTKQMVFVDGKREKFKDHSDFYLNPFRYDATARIGWGRVNLFASYSLNQLFKEGKGPELYPFSAGIRVASF